MRSRTPLPRPVHLPLALLVLQAKEQETRFGAPGPAPRNREVAWQPRGDDNTAGLLVPAELTLQR